MQSCRAGSSCTSDCLAHTSCKGPVTGWNICPRNSCGADMLPHLRWHYGTASNLCCLACAIPDQASLLTHPLTQMHSQGRGPFSALPILILLLHPCGNALQDAARPTVLLLLLQKALQLAAEQPSAVSRASLQSRSKQEREESWPVSLATSVCHQVCPCIRHPCKSSLHNTSLYHYYRTKQVLKALVTAETSRRQATSMQCSTGCDHISLGDIAGCDQQ